VLERGVKMDRLLVTGGSGLLGSNVAYLGSDRFVAQLTYNSHPVSVPGCASVRMDLTNGIDVRRTVERFRPHLIVHTAALLPAKLCEENPALARAIHIDGVGYLCDAAREVGANLIHISTDWVFEGTQELYREEDTPTPINEYGRSKLGSERVVQESGVDHCIIRPSLYGWNFRRNKFCYAEMVLETLGRGEKFFAPDDQYFAPILVNVLAEAMFEIYARNITGVLHVTGSEVCSRYGFCKTAAEVFGLDRDLVKPVAISREYFGVNVPRHQSLDVSRAKSLLTTKLPGIREGILEMKRLQDSGYVERLRGQSN
jgi:dTDP-4-dehydrorhamnose reductase